MSDFDEDGDETVVSGEYCRVHFTRPCGCDLISRLGLDPDTKDTMSEEHEDAFIQKALGTPDSVESILWSLGFHHFYAEEVAEEVLLNANIERCSECEWWCEVGDLVNPDSGEPCPCESCR